MEWPAHPPLVGGGGVLICTTNLGNVKPSMYSSFDRARSQVSVN